MEWKKWVAVWGVAIVVGFYTTFVLQCLWNWFAVEALHAPQISYVIMYGIMMFVKLLLQNDTFGTDTKFKHLGILVDACVPEEKRHEVKDLLNEEEKSMPWQVGGMVIGQVFGNTFTLALGWAIHTFLA